MGRPKWTQIPTSFLDKEEYGRIVDAYSHVAGYLLLHHKSLRPSDPGYKRIGQWYLVVGKDVINLKAYVGRELRDPPIKWANKEIYQRQNNAVPPNIPPWRRRMHNARNPSRHPELSDGAGARDPRV